MRGSHTARLSLLARPPLARPFAIGRSYAAKPHPQYSLSRTSFRRCFAAHCCPPMAATSNGKLTVSELRLKKSKKELQVTWSDGRSVSFPSLLLRQKSRSAEQVGHGEASFKPKAIPLSVSIVSLVPVGNYAVRIEFDDLHTSGIYSWEYLRELSDELVDQPQNGKITLETGEELHYLHWPSRVPGSPALLCLHGFNQTAHSWDEFAPRIRGHYNVYALDQRGHGDSYKVGLETGDYSYQACLNDVSALLKQLNIDKLTLVGMSMGAFHSTLFTRSHQNIVEKLILVDWAPKVEETGIEKIMAGLDFEAVSFEAAVEEMRKFAPQRTYEQIYSRLKHSMHQKENGKWGWRLDKEKWKSRIGNDLSEEAPRLWQLLSEIVVPTLIVRGKLSNVLSEETARKVIDTMPHATLVQVDNAGHSVAGDNPQGFFHAVKSFIGLADH